MIPDKLQAAFLTKGWLTKDMIVKGGHVVDMCGQFFLRLPKLKLQLFVSFGDGVEAAIQIANLLCELAHFRAMKHVTLLQGLGVLLLLLGNQCRQVCSFVHTGLHVRAVP